MTRHEMETAIRDVRTTLLGLEGRLHDPELKERVGAAYKTLTDVLSSWHVPEDRERHG